MDPSTKIEGELLRSVPAFAGLSGEVHAELAAASQSLRIRADEWLFRQGDTADSVYVVRSGRLEVVAEGPPPRVIRVLRRGDVVGELAMLRQGVRSASVRASRDSELAELSREEFEALITGVPSFALALIRTLGAELADSRTPTWAASPPQSIAVVGLEPGAPSEEIADLLVAALREHGTVGIERGQPGAAAAEMSQRLDRAEAAEDRVVLIGSSTAPGDEWTDFCLGQADLTLAVTRGVPDRRWLDHAALLHGCELVVAGGTLDDATFETLRPRELQIVPDGEERRRRMEVTARRMTGRAIGVVLSGGGARAIAHIGVLEELRNAGVTIDRIGAVSLGAVVGAYAATGASPEELSETLKLRTLTVGSIDTVAAARRHADLVISPSVGEIGIMQFDAFPHAVEAGRVAAR